MVVAGVVRAGLMPAIGRRAGGTRRASLRSSLLPMTVSIMRAVHASPLLRMVFTAVMLAIPPGVVVATFVGRFRAARIAARRRAGIPRGIPFPGCRVGHERDHAHPSRHGPVEEAAHGGRRGPRRAREQNAPHDRGDDEPAELPGADDEPATLPNAKCM